MESALRARAEQEKWRRTPNSENFWAGDVKGTLLKIFRTLFYSKPSELHVKIFAFRIYPEKHIFLEVCLLEYGCLLSWNTFLSHSPSFLNLFRVHKSILRGQRGRVGEGKGVDYAETIHLLLLRPCQQPGVTLDRRQSPLGSPAFHDPSKGSWGSERAAHQLSS